MAITACEHHYRAQNMEKRVEVGPGPANMEHVDEVGSPYGSLESGAGSGAVGDAEQLRRNLSAAQVILSRNALVLHDERDCRAATHSLRGQSSCSSYEKGAPAAGSGSIAAAVDVDGAAEGGAEVEDGATTLWGLVEGVRSLFRQSTFGLRSHDESGPRIAFELLAEPSKHEVTFRRTVVDLVFKDELSVAERLGIMRFTNPLNLVFYVLYFTLGNVILLVVLPLCIFLIARLWQPDVDGTPQQPDVDGTPQQPERVISVENVMLGLWVAWYLPSIAWQISYHLSYAHVSALKASLRENRREVAWLVATRLCYTVTNALFCPTLWNVVALAHAFVMVSGATIWHASMVFFRLRMTRETYEKFFVPKVGVKARLQLFFDSFPTFIDVARHYAILYAFELEREAEGFDLASEERSLAEMTVAGRAFNVTLRELMNASFGASLAFRLHYILANFGGIGTKVTGMPHCEMVNTK